MTQTVKYYVLQWFGNANSGRVLFWLEDDTGALLEVNTLEELDALGNILRNEKPIRFNPELKHVYSGWEAVGEGEVEAATFFANAMKEDG
jgi:hypothetical protein